MGLFFKFNATIDLYKVLFVLLLSSLLRSNFCNSDQSGGMGDGVSSSFGTHSIFSLFH